MAILTGIVASINSLFHCIRRSLTEWLKHEGAIVVTYVSNREKSKAGVSIIEANGPNAIALQFNLTNIDSICTLSQKALKHFGRLNISVIEVVPLDLRSLSSGQVGTSFNLSCRLIHRITSLPSKNLSST